MIRYDDTPLVIGAWWRTPECAALANPPAVTPIPVVPTLMPPQKVSLSADGLFRFDGSRPEDLLPEGRERMARLASEIRTQFKVLHHQLHTGAAAHLRRLRRHGG